MTEMWSSTFNRTTGMNLTPVFDQYLRHASLPTLELTFDDAKGTVSYRWKADEPAFAMPVRWNERPLADHSTRRRLADHEDASPQRPFEVATDPLLRQRCALAD